MGANMRPDGGEIDLICGLPVLNGAYCETAHPLRLSWPALFPGPMSSDSAVKSLAGSALQEPSAAG